MNNKSELADSSQGISVATSLPLRIKVITDASADLSIQNQMAFDIIEAFEHSEGLSSHEQSVQTRQLENKLNTIVKLLRLLLTSRDTVPPKQSLTLSATTLQWHQTAQGETATEVLKENQDIEVSFYPGSELPWPIKRIARIIKLDYSQTPIEVTARFYPVDGQTTERFEKWIFRLHRQFIRQNKQ